MTKTKTKPKTISRKTTVPESAELFVPKVPMPTVAAAVTQTVDLTPSEVLKNQCLGVRVTFNWYRTSRQVDKVAKQEMAVAANSSEEGFSASKNLMDSKHPVVKEANELQSRISGYFKSMTVPLAGFVSGRGRPEPGVRLLNVSKVEEFDARMNSFKPELEAMTVKLNAALPDIKIMDQARLKGLYRQDDYPDVLSLDFSWGFINVDVPRALEQLAPQVYAREQQRLVSRMDETYEMATNVVLSEFLNVISEWTRILGPVIKIHPDENNPLSAEYFGAEIRQKLEEGHHELKLANPDGKPVLTEVDVPAGQLSLVLRYYPKDSKRIKESVVGPMTAAVYAALKPSEIANARQTIHTSTIEGMTTFLGMFHNVQQQISPSRNLGEMVKTVERHMSQLPTAAAVATELKNSTTFRTETHKLMVNLSAGVMSEIEHFKTSRRRVNVGGGAKG